MIFKDLALTIVHIFFLSSLSQAEPPTGAKPPTYNDIVSLVFRPLCVDCHSSPGASADLDLFDYASLMKTSVITAGNPSGSLLFQKVESGEMPFGGDPLTKEQLALVEAWIAAGAPDSPPPTMLTLSKVTPRFGPTTGGTLLSLEGSELIGVTKVLLGESECKDINIKDNSHIECLTPDTDNPGLVSVSVTDGVNTSTLDKGFEYRIPLEPNYLSLLENIFRPKCLSCHSGPTPKKGLDLSTYDSLLSYPRAVIPGNVKRSRLYKIVREGEMPKDADPLPNEEVQAIAQWIARGAPRN
jgi:mono/diheme cytochrome c family protein